MATLFPKTTITNVILKDSARFSVTIYHCSASLWKVTLSLKNQLNFVKSNWYQVLLTEVSSFYFELWRQKPPSKSECISWIQLKSISQNYQTFWHYFVLHFQVNKKNVESANSLIAVVLIDLNSTSESIESLGMNFARVWRWLCQLVLKWNH